MSKLIYHNIVLSVLDEIGTKEYKDPEEHKMLFEKILHLYYDIESAKQLLPEYRAYVKLVNIYYEQLKRFKNIETLKPKQSIKNARFEYECQMFRDIISDSGNQQNKNFISDEVSNTEKLWEDYYQKIKESKSDLEMIKRMCKSSYSKIKPIKKNGILFHEKYEDIQDDCWVLRNKSRIFEEIRNININNGMEEFATSSLNLSWERDPAII
jgi:hypothetical protein